MNNKFDFVTNESNTEATIGAEMYKKIKKKIKEDRKSNLLSSILRFDFTTLRCQRYFNGKKFLKSL